METANKTIELLDKLLESKRNLVNDLIDKGEEASFNEPLDALLQKASEYIPKSYVFVDDSGNEVAAILVGEETVFDATENDVRVGKTFGTAAGVKTGNKVIPTYHTTEGQELIISGNPFVITFANDLYDFTKLLVVICPYNASIAKSVAANKIAINDGVYAVNSTELIATVTKDSTNKSIDLGIINDSGSLYVLRYITYKEIY